MLFSNNFKVNKTGSEEWFDPILDDDTLLFVDPFLIYLDNEGVFKGGYQRVMDFFEMVFAEAAQIPYNENNSNFRILLNKLVFKEPREACLGYSIGSVDGSGSGNGFAKNIINAVYDSINAGINNLNHFEELGIFSSKIKEDRISDITINILKEEFIKFTQIECSKLNIDLENLRCRIFDPVERRWMVKSYLLPKNPINNGPIILIPKRFLSSINALNSQDFFDYCWEQYDDDVRDQLNVDIKSKVDKNKIIDIAKSNPDWMSSYITFKENQKDNSAYDLDTDPSGVYRWHSVTEDFVINNPIDLVVSDQSSFLIFLRELASKFTQFVEENDGNLYLVDNAGRPKREKASQLLLYGLIKHYCKSLSCKITVKEAGKGFIDFKFPNDFSNKAFIEIKYVRNNGVLKTFETFLNKINNGDEVIYGNYFIVSFKLQELDLALELEDDFIGLAEEHNLQLKYYLIDASINN